MSLESFVKSVESVLNLLFWGDQIPEGDAQSIYEFG